MDSNPTPPMLPCFYSDEPIERREDDRLGRNAFAESVAQQIRNVPTGHGFTIAVTGQWGTGKTSVLNMVAEVLECDRGNISVLRFNPWLFRGTTELVARFFQELSTQLGQDRPETLKNVAKQLSTLGQSLAPLSPVPGTTFIANLAAILIGSWTKPQSLFSQHKQLRGTLAESGLKIVVLIDDIDRLEPAEIREVMRLVRLTSEMPSIIFLLAFDRRHVAMSLGEDLEGGQQYLEKIVQVTYNLPVARDATLAEVFLPSLEELVNDHDVTDLDQNVWRQVLYEIIKPLLGNLRDMKRYLFSLSATLNMVGREVALADLLGLEAVRVLRPALFEDLRSHSECLVYSSSDGRLTAALGGQRQENVDELSKMLKRSGTDQTIMSSVFKILFPATQEFLGHSYYGESIKTAWRKERRVACEEVLRIYLQSGLDDTAIPSGDIRAILESLDDETKLTELLGSLDDDRLGYVLDRLEDYEMDYPIESIPVAVPILTNSMAKLSPAARSPLDISVRFKASRVILRMLRRVGDPETLASLMCQILPKVDSLSGRLQLVEMVGHRESIGHELVSEKQARKFEKQIVADLTSATAPQLRTEWDLVGLALRAVRRLPDEDKFILAERLREHLSDDELVLALLRAAINAGNTFSDGQRTIRLLPWDALLDVFGEGLGSAVDRLADSQWFLENAEEGDRDTVELAKRYATGKTGVPVIGGGKLDHVGG